MAEHDAGPAAAVLDGTALQVRFRRDGSVGAVVPVARPEVRWLDAFGTLDVTTPDGALDLGPPVARFDPDEVEVERTAGGLRTLVRHSVEQGWDVRLVLANDGVDDLTLTGVRLGCRAGGGCVAAALAAGATASYAVQPADGDGPVLLGRLRSGSQAGVDAGGFVLGPRVLPAGHRWATSWRFRVVATARDAADGDLPRTTWLDLDQAVLLPAGPDVAVVAPGLRLEVEEHRVEVGADRPGTGTVELRGARGTTALELTWAPDLDAVVDATAAALLRGPQTPAGTPRLTDAAAGLVVQDALARRSLGSGDDLADAVELLAGSLADGPDDEATPDPFAVALLAREAGRTNDRVLLDLALRSLLRVRRPAPGVGVAGAAVVLSLVGAGRAPDDAVAHLAALGGGASDGPGALELALLLRPRDRPPEPPLLAALRRLGASLGAGLPGRLLPPHAPDRVGYAAALLGLVDEPTGQRLRDAWGVSAAEVGRRAAAEARARTAGAGGGATARAALAWLVLGRPPG